MPSSSQNSRKGELSNCRPLLDMKVLGIPNLHMIVFHTNPLYVLLRDCREWFGFHPLGEIVDVNDKEFQLPSSDGERSHDIQTPLG